MATKKVKRFMEGGGGDYGEGEGEGEGQGFGTGGDPFGYKEDFGENFPEGYGQGPSAVTYGEGRVTPPDSENNNGGSRDSSPDMTRRTGIRYGYSDSLGRRGEGTSYELAEKEAKRNLSEPGPYEFDVNDRAKGGMIKKYAKGGSVSSASSRADGIAQRGKTRGKMC